MYYYDNDKRSDEHFLGYKFNPVYGCYEDWWVSTEEYNEMLDTFNKIRIACKQPCLKKIPLINLNQGDWVKRTLFIKLIVAHYTKNETEFKNIVSDFIDDLYEHDETFWVDRIQHQTGLEIEYKTGLKNEPKTEPKTEPKSVNYDDKFFQEAYIQKAYTQKLMGLVSAED